MTYIPNPEMLTNKNQPNGYAGLSGTGTFSPSQLQTFISAGPSHKAGVVPSPGAVAGNARFLADNGTWVYPICAVRNQFEYVGLTSAISSTELINSTVHGTGLFRTTFYASITTPGTSGNLVITISWIDHSNTTQTLTYNLDITVGASGDVGKVNDLVAFRLGPARACNFSTSFSGTPGAVAYYFQIVVDKVEQPF